MARSHARLLTSIWTDSDFRRLDAMAQRVYMLALSQPNISFCGVVAYTAKRWAMFAADTTAAKIRAAVAQLQAARYVVVDEDTEELLVRSFTKHDGVLKSPNVVTAMSREYADIISPWIREGFLQALGEGFREGLPEGLWEGLGEPFREGFREQFPKGFREGLPEGLGKGLPEGLGEPLSRAHARALRTHDAEPLPPSPSPSPPPPPAAGEPLSVEDSWPAAAPANGEEEESALRRTCQAVAERRLRRRRANAELEPIANPEAWLAKTAEGVAGEHAVWIRELLSLGKDPEAAAAVIDPDPVRAPANGRAESPELARARLNDARRDRPCQHCDGVGGHDTAAGWTRCEACQGVGVGA